VGGAAYAVIAAVVQQWRDRVTDRGNISDSHYNAVRLQRCYMLTTTLDYTAG